MYTTCILINNLHVPRADAAAAAAFYIIVRSCGARAIDGGAIHDEMKNVVGKSSV